MDQNGMRFRTPGFSRKNKPEAVRARQRGFSLLELCIVILISGITYAMVFEMLSHNQEAKAFKTRQTMQRLQWGMAEYFRIFGYYPCPADPTLPTSDANYGVEGRVAATGACTIGVAGGVATGMVPVRTLNTAVGCSNVDEDGRFSAGAMMMPDRVRDVVQTALNSARQVIMTGAADVMDMSAQKRRCIDPSFANDVYDDRITYAVTVNSTRLNTINIAAGAIRVLDRNGNDVTANRQHFVLVSAGPDQAGAFTRNGNAGPACGAALDRENCDGDDTFRSMPMAQIGMPGDANHFDDTIMFSVYGFRQEDTDWRWNATVANEAMNSPRNITMMNGNAVVGIGRMPAVMPADAKLVVGGGNVQVDGNVRVENSADIRTDQDVTSGANVTANRFFYSPKYCYKTPITTDCGAP